jgi:exodeoxyribonuclease V gamma subunit
VLEIHAADRAEALADLLVEVLSVAPGDPFEPDWVAVPSIGMRRWLSQRLARRLGARPGATDGISANIELPFLAELRHLVLDARLPHEPAAPSISFSSSASDPWSVDRLLWSVLAVLHSSTDDPQLRPLTELAPGATLVGRARRLADLLDRYSVHRPQLLLGWARGFDHGPAGERLGPELRWQPHLFRRVRQQIGQPSPPERLPALLAAIAEGSVELALPSRLALFGLSTMAPDLGPVLEALAVGRQVRVFALTPSPALARSTMAAAAAVAPPAADDGVRTWSFPRKLDPTVDLARHPLLRSWGQPGRELAAQIGAAGVAVSGLDASPPPPPRDASLLQRVQHDVAANRAPAGSHVLAADDQSIQIHACSGATRQVEALRDAIGALLAADPTLTEGDIVVICPQLAGFIPLIEAVFGPSATSAAGPVRAGPPALRYRITDRSRRERNPVLGALDAVLRLVGGRFTASAVSAVLSLDPVRRRFGLSADDLSLLDRWIGETNIRWGLDGEHRDGWGIPADFTANSWEAGLDQLLVGVAVADGAGVVGPGDVVPMPVEGGDAAAAGRIAAAVRTLGAVADGLAGPRPIASWCDDLAVAADLLFDGPTDQAWQRRRLDALLDRLARDARTGDVSCDVPLTQGDVGRLLQPHLEGDPARAAFGSGAITICSMLPLRSVPHRVVCLLGLDHDSMPRGGVDGDDLLALQPDVGDREPRADARQLLLEAVLAARDTLVVTWSGTDVRTNQPSPPAVVLDELWDCLAATTADGRDAVVARVGVSHKRQAFDPANFVAPPRSFDPVALAGARAFVQRGADAGRDAALVPTALAPVRPDAVDLADLREFLRHPVRSFLRRRLEVRLPRDEPGAVDTLPVRLDNLEAWSLGEDLLESARRGVDPDRWLRNELARGAIPPAALGTAAVEAIRDEVSAIVAIAADLGIDLAPRDHHPIDIDVSGLRVVGSVGPCAPPPRPGPVASTYSRAKPSQRLVLWLDLLVLTLTDPETSWRAAGLSRNPTSSKKNQPHVDLLRVSGADPTEREATARQALEVLVELYLTGMAQPLPLFDRTSAALAAGDRPKAQREWQGSDFSDAYEDHHRLAFGDRTFAEIEQLTVAGRSTAAWASQLWDAVAGSLTVEPVDPQPAGGDPRPADGDPSVDQRGDGDALVGGPERSQP